jgi:endoglucanase
MKRISRLNKANERFLCIISCLFLFLFAGFSCSSSNNSDTPSEPEVKTLTVKQNNYRISASTTKITLEITSSDNYYVTSNKSWVSPSSSAASKATKYDLNIEANTNYAERTDTITITSGNLKAYVYILQQMNIPTIAANQDGMTHKSMELMHLINVGWNLGNSCDAAGNETAWGNPKTTEAMIKAVKAAGFNTIRIPVRWGDHISDTSLWTIDESWMARVKEIVDYAYNNGLYVILNSHHDAWFEGVASYADSAAVRRKEVSMWTQIAVKFRDYDEHLMFACLNEPHIGDNWGVPSTENAKVESFYQQAFVNIVRATGGRNTYRSLIIQPWCCNPSYFSYLTIPTDPTPNRMILEFHYYNPWNFCGTDSGNDGTDKVRFWGDSYKQYGSVSTYGTAAMITNDFSTLKTNFISKGIPVVLGEFGVNRHTFTAAEIKSGLQAKGEESRDYYLKWLVSTAHAYGITPIYWDNGNLGTATDSTVMGSGSDAFALFNRKGNMSVYDKGAIDAIIEGAKTAYTY